MQKYFPSWTHILVRTLSREEFEKSEVFAYMDVCFGPGDKNAITNIRWKKVGEGSMVLPPITHVIKEGYTKITGDLDRKTVPVFTGALSEELVDICIKAIMKLKSNSNFRLAYSKTYRVTEKTVIEVNQ